MLLDRECFNSGDKFILSMSNLDRTRHFHRYGIKYFHDFSSLFMNETSSYRTNKKYRVSLIFEKLHLEVPRTFDVEDVKINMNFKSIDFIFTLIFRISNANINVSYKITYHPSTINLCKFSDVIYDSHTILKKWKVNNNESLYAIFNIDAKLSLWRNIVNLYNYLIYADTYLEAFVNDYQNNKLQNYFDKWKLIQNNSSRMLYINGMLNQYPIFAQFYIDYNRYFGIMSMLQMHYMTQSEILHLIKTDYINNFYQIDEILQKFYKQHINN